MKTVRRGNGWNHWLIRWSAAMFVLGAGMFGGVTVPALAEESRVPTAETATLSLELQDLVAFLDQQAASSGGIWSRIASVSEFQAFLGAAEERPTDPVGQRALVGRYLKDSFSRLANPETLYPRQAESLRQSLWFHGATDVSEADGYRLLRKISAANLERFLAMGKASPATPSPEIQKEIDELTARIRPVFIHNTNLLKRLPEIPLVSSKEIRRTAGIGGLNTFFFNRGFLHSDDNLFFFVDLELGNLKRPATKSIYGEYQFIPDAAFAAERGWMSAFVMYPYDLLRFADSVRKEDVGSLTEVMFREYTIELGTGTLEPVEIAKKLRNIRRDAPRSVRVLRNGFSGWNRLRHSLYLMDLNVADYTTLIRTVFSRWLGDLAATDPARFRATMVEIRSKGPGGFQGDVLRSQLGLKLYFEFKIPVALPPGQMRQLDVTE